MEEIFDLFDEGNDDLVRDINETVNHAIDSAMRTGLKEAAANIKISVQMEVDNDGIIHPIFTYKTGVKLGVSIDMLKGKKESLMGLVRDSSGYWRSVRLNEQTRIEGA